MNLRKAFLTITCLAVLGIAVPQGMVFAQHTGDQGAGQTQRQRELQQQREQEQEQLRRHYEFELQLQRHLNQQLQQQQQHRQTVMWNVQVVNAATFERLFYMREDVVRDADVPLEVFRTQEWITLTAHGVSGQEEAMWNIRRQLGFPAYSDLRTVGGVTQRIIWGEVLSQVAAITPTPAGPVVVVPTAPIAPAVDQAVPRRRWPWILAAVVVTIGAIVFGISLNTGYY